MDAIASPESRILSFTSERARKAKKAHATRAVVWKGNSVADIVSGLALFGVVGWAMWYIGVQLIHVLVAGNAQMTEIGT